MNTAMQSKQASRGLLFHITLFLLTTVLAVLLGFGATALVGLEATGEPALRSSGGLLQLLGVAAVGYGIMQLRREFGLPSLAAEWREETSQTWVKTKAWMGRILHRPQTVELPRLGSAFSTGTLSIKTRGKRGPGPEATLEERVELLEKLLDRQQDAVWRLEDRLEGQSRRMTEALDAEAQARTTSIAAVQDRFHHYATSDLHLETVGLGWVLLGTVLSTWAPEIGKAL